MVKIQSPVANFKGEGPGGLVFVDGQAETDDVAIVGYCQSAGYLIDGKQVNPAPAEPRRAASGDSRDVRDKLIGSPLRDAATDPQPGDNGPAGAGTGDPHGPGVASDPSQAVRIAAEAAKAAKAAKAKDAEAAKAKAKTDAEKAAKAKAEAEAAK